MEKKNQIYLSAFIMYLIVGFAGYINQATNYWVVLLASILVAAFTFTCTLGIDKEDIKKTRIEWISVYAFTALELLLTIFIAIAKVPSIGFFKYFNYTIQVLGSLFAIYAVIRFVISYTHIDSFIKEKFSKKNTIKEETVIDQPVEEFATKVEETIAEETTIHDAQVDTSDVEIVGESKKEQEVIGIEYKTQKEVNTPYMEEEL